MRIKRGTVVRKRHKKLLKATKGYHGGRKNLYKQAKQAWIKAGQHAYMHRRTKKRDFRSLWIININAACRVNGIKYSEFIAGLKKNKIELDRKVLADIAENNPEEFAKIVKEVKS